MERTDEQYQFEFFGSPKKFPRILHNATSSVAVYTIFCILKVMRKQLCLEAMLEYMEQYLATVEKANPSLKEAVGKALTRVNIKQIYKDATS